jgi:hypothetical protein
MYVTEDFLAERLRDVLVEALHGIREVNVRVAVACRAFSHLSLPSLGFAHGIPPPRNTRKGEGHGSRCSHHQSYKRIVFWQDSVVVSPDYLGGDSTQPASLGRA